MALYRLVWQRTLASQMADATGVTVSVRLAANATDRTTGELTDCEFAASGTTITFPGYRAVYVASKEETGDDEAENEALLPPLTQGDEVPIASIEPNGHSTSPPARYTEASLVKRLEELGIGRPSTWASIIQTVQDRGYVWKKGQALVPTWTAFAVVRLLEEHFDALVDYDFTASIDHDLDEIANGQTGEGEMAEALLLRRHRRRRHRTDLGRGRLRRRRAARAEAARGGEPRRDRRRRDQHLPARARRRRPTDRGEAGQVRSLRQARRRHRERARRPDTRRADGRQGDRIARRCRSRTTRSANSTGTRCTRRTVDTAPTCSGATTTIRLPDSRSRRCRACSRR